MKITKIELYRFKRFLFNADDTFKRDFSRCNLLLWKNGYGKSSLLSQLNPFAIENEDYGENGYKKIEFETPKTTILCEVSKNSWTATIRERDDDKAVRHTFPTKSSYNEFVTGLFFDKKHLKVLNGSFSLTEAKPNERREVLRLIGGEGLKYMKDIIDNITEISKENKILLKNTTAELNGLLKTDGELNMTDIELENAKEAIHKYLDYLLLHVDAVDRSKDENYCLMLSDEIEKCYKENVKLDSELALQGITYSMLDEAMKEQEESVKKMSIDLKANESVVKKLQEDKANMLKQVSDSMVKEMEDKIKAEISMFTLAVKTLANSKGIHADDEMLNKLISPNLDSSKDKLDYLYTASLLVDASKLSKINLFSSHISTILEKYSDFLNVNVRRVLRETGDKLEDLYKRIEESDKLRSNLEYLIKEVQSASALKVKCDCGNVISMDDKLKVLQEKLNKANIGHNEFIKDRDRLETLKLRIQAYIEKLSIVEELPKYLDTSIFQYSNPTFGNSEIIIKATHEELQAYNFTLTENIEKLNTMVKYVFAMIEYSKQLEEMSSSIYTKDEDRKAKLEAIDKEIDRLSTIIANLDKEMKEKNKVLELITDKKEVSDRLYQLLDAFKDAKKQLIANIVNESISDTVREVRGLEKVVNEDLQKVALKNNLLDTLRKDKAKFEANYNAAEVLKSLFTSPGGIRDRYLLNTFGELINDMNSFIEHVWSYELKVDEIGDVGDDNSDYSNITVTVNGGRVDDISKLSKGTRDLIDLAFRLAVMKKFYNLNGDSYPLLLDEFGSSLDSEHASKAFDYLETILEDYGIEQMFLSCHHSDLYGRLYADVYKVPYM